MKHILTTILFTLIIAFGFAQRVPQVPDSIRKNYKEARALEAAAKKVDYTGLNQDSIIKVKLVKLALENPTMHIAAANQRIAEAELAKAKLSWLNSFAAGANVNEFVIQGSAAASFFPKYNVGVSLPFDVVTRLKRDKKVARENIVISNENAKDRQNFLKAQVLIAYENYKEKKEMVLLQKSSIEYDFSAYEAAQANYTAGDISMEEMNKTHQSYLSERAKLLTKEKELNIAIIDLEQLIGVPLSKALQLP
ncbi:MAG: hypothetical protein EOO03_12545 [Chitinophagaceae bacterium]|nr:MAG: hypothetical protein EOO03_12545 [Chitinophagaceae bacterium]